MTPPSRFASPTSGLNLNVLLGRLRQSLWLSLALAVLVHVMVVGVNPFEQQARKSARPMTTKFTKRQPRLTKPLELRKVPKRKRQMHRRHVRLATARMNRVQATAAFSTRNIIAGLTGVSKMHYGHQSTSLAPDAAVETGMTLDVDLTISRIAENRIDMALEMLDLGTGRVFVVLHAEAIFLNMQTDRDPKMIPANLHTVQVYHNILNRTFLKREA